MIVSDPDKKEIVWESPDWVRVSEARALADVKRWQFASTAVRSSAAFRSLSSGDIREL